MPPNRVPQNNADVKERELIAHRCGEDRTGFYFPAPSKGVTVLAPETSRGSYKINNRFEDNSYIVKW